MKRVKISFVIQSIAFFIILAFGITLRYFQLSPFKFYPDSYENLLVSENISNFHSVVGFLGKGGMVYPDFFMWTRPGFALLVNIFSFFLKNTTNAAQTTSFLAGIAALPLAFFTIKKILNSAIFALAGMFLLSISYIHAVWGGFIMTETTGVFLMLLFLLCLFTNISQEKKIFEIQDLITGIIFAATVITRYEYIVIFLPAIFLIVATNPKPVPKIFTILFSFALTMTFVAFELFPIRSVFSVINSQTHDMLIIGIVISIIFIFIILLSKRNEFILKKLAILSLAFLWSFSIIISLQIILGKNAFLWKDLSYVRNFVIHDPLLGIFSLLGLTIMFLKKNYIVLGLFVFLSVFSLGIIYHKINPEIDRYMVHLLPFLLIPSSIAFAKTLGITFAFFKKRKSLGAVLLAIIVVLISCQLFLTLRGIRYLNDPSWYRISYEEKSALLAAKFIPKDAIIIVSLPEPYFYNLNTPTQSIADTPPFVYMDNTPDAKQVVIISDMGMHDIFPNFTNFLTRSMEKQKIAQYLVNERFHIINRSEIEKHPVILYKTTLGELREKIKKYSQ